MDGSIARLQALIRQTQRTGDECELTLALVFVVLDVERPMLIDATRARARLLPILKEANLARREVEVVRLKIEKRRPRAVGADPRAPL